MKLTKMYGITEKLSKNSDSLISDSVQLDVLHKGRLQSRSRLLGGLKFRFCFETKINRTIINSNYYPTNNNVHSLI